MKNKNNAQYFREAADRVWDLAEEYHSKKHYDISLFLRELSEELHKKAREAEDSENNLEY